jgi:hypothetical protein
MAGMVGGVLSLFRSSGTGAAVTATLERSKLLEEKLASLERGVSGAGLGLEAQFAATPQELGVLVERMLRLAVPLREAPKMDAITLWVRDDATSEWRIFAGFGVSDETLARFRQPVLSTQTNGAGFVANMATTMTRLLPIPSDPSSHPWHANDPGAAKKSGRGSFVAVLLVDRSQSPFGALCLTSAESAAFPSESDLVQFTRFKNVVSLWASAFTFVLERYFELGRPAQRQK